MKKRWSFGSSHKKDLFRWEISLLSDSLWVRGKYFFSVQILSSKWAFLIENTIYIDGASSVGILVEEIDFY